MKTDRHRITVLAAVCGGVGIARAGGAYAYDSPRDDLIADGVTVSGVDVGGLHAGAAKRKLRAELAGRLDRPVRVAVAGRRFRLTPEAASLVADVDGMVD